MERRDPKLEQRLLQALNGARIGKPCYAFREVSSTMERAHALVREGAGEGTLVFAARQEQGRGRLGRRWESPEGGAYFSLILKPSRPPAESPQLSLVAGLAVAETIYEQLERASRPRRAPSQQGWSPKGVPDAARDGPPHQTSPAPSCSILIRWPNDILLDGKKVAGILTEAKDGAVVVGIGINVTTDPKDLPDTATSLAACGAACDLYQLAAELCRKFDGWYDIWSAQGFVPIRKALRPRLNLGALVRVIAGGSQVEGQATDVDEQGRLLVRLDSGLVHAFDVGEVTLLR